MNRQVFRSWTRFRIPRSRLWSSIFWQPRFRSSNQVQVRSHWGTYGRSDSHLFHAQKNLL